MQLSRYSLFCKKLKISDNHGNHEAIIAISTVDHFRALYGPTVCTLYSFCPLLCSALSTALYLLYGSLPALQSSVPLRPTVLTMVLCLLYSRLSPSKALCPLFSPLSPSTIFCTLYGPMSPLWSSAPYGPLLPLRRSVQPLRPSILSMTLCFLNSPLSSLLPSFSSSALIPSMALCLI
jgi:hypothetical protein